MTQIAGSFTVVGDLLVGDAVSDNRGVGPCILAMRMAFRNLTKLPENFKFIADGYSAYPLAAMEFVDDGAGGGVYDEPDVGFDAADFDVCLICGERL